MIIKFVCLVLIFGLLKSDANPLSNTFDRILGGHYSEKDQFPFQISLRLNGKHRCGGSIYSAKYVITAAHCVINRSTRKPYSPSELTVLLGTIYLHRDGKEVSVHAVIPHEKYGFASNDIALVALSRSISFSTSISPIKLYTGNVPVGSDIVISGWGLTSNFGKISERLKYNTQKKMSQSKCDQFLNYVVNTTGIICLEHPSKNGACKGDSGGPAIYNKELVGVASFTFGICGSSFAPDGYTFIPHYIDWIKNHAT